MSAGLGAEAVLQHLPGLRLAVLHPGEQIQWLASKGDDAGNAKALPVGPWEDRLTVRRLAWLEA